MRAQIGDGWRNNRRTASCPRWRETNRATRRLRERYIFRRPGSVRGIDRGLAGRLAQPCHATFNRRVRRRRSVTAPSAIYKSCGARMRRREFIAGLVTAAASPLAAHAQSTSRRYRIGVLDTSARQLNAISGASGQVSRRHMTQKRHASAWPDRRRWPCRGSPYSSRRIVDRRALPAGSNAASASSIVYFWCRVGPTDTSDIVD
jgi:hypothetical protein